ncbi:unnamed protein product [Miscanthus lutarioriparius]|uniref:Uncharacterized protein n=1 Tax=Miscanthus lutarioriparius TaxID=422564 RepID=A0A811QT13_9POAL|nr:unnamed protein product [Miscanthus lutarioriparius]
MVDLGGDRDVGDLPQGPGHRPVPHVAGSVHGGLQLFKRFLMWQYGTRCHGSTPSGRRSAGGGGGARAVEATVACLTRRSWRRFVNLPEIVALAEEVGIDAMASYLMSATTAVALAAHLWEEIDIDVGGLQVALAALHLWFVVLYMP